MHPPGAFMSETASTATAAFDEVANSYDAIEAGNRIFQWMRQRVQHTALSAFPQSARILEVGCGTGTDALFFAQRGYHIVAMDASEEMLRIAAEKIAMAGFAHGVELLLGEAESMDELVERYGETSFDGIFSNFGALNCVADLHRFARSAARLLRPGGKMLFSIMPPICPWEILYYLLRLQPWKALRRNRGRLCTGGISVCMGNRRVQTYYYSRAALKQAFAPAFASEMHFALGLFVPPPYLQGIALHSMFFRRLLRCEEIFAGWPLLRNFGDHLIVILRKRRA